MQIYFYKQIHIHKELLNRVNDTCKLVKISGCPSYKDTINISCMYNLIRIIGVYTSPIKNWDIFNIYTLKSRPYF